MFLSLYDAVVPTWLQILGSMEGLVDKAEGFASENGLAANELIEASLYEDMLPFAYQIKSCAVHSAGAIEGIRSGTFAPDQSVPPSDWEGLRTKLAEARATLGAIEADELEALADGETVFSFRGKPIYRFASRKFLLSFSNPNFMFHSATAYDILRMKGVPLVKRDFLGRLQIEPQ